MTAPAAKKAAAKAPAKKKESDSYRVSAPLIQVEVGSQILQYSFGDVLPDGIREDNLKHLLENGLVEKGDESVSDADAEPSDDDN